MPDLYRIDRECRQQRILEQDHRIEGPFSVSLISMPQTVRRGPDKAWKLCPGVVFQAAFEYCSLVAEDDVWLLSPVHGLLAPDAIVAGVSMCLNEMLPTTQEDWACDVIGDLMEHYEQSRLNVSLFASPVYVMAIRRALKMSFAGDLDETFDSGWNWTAPFEMCGPLVSDKLHFLSELGRRD